MIATLVTAAVIVAMFAAGEFVASSAAHMPVSEANELLQQAISDFREHCKRKTFEDRQIVLALRRALDGSERPLNWRNYLAGRSEEQNAAIERDLKQAEQALERGEPVKFQHAETRMFVHLFRQQESRHKGRAKK